MDLSSPLRTLIPSLDSAVLEVLCRVETPLSASAIWRASARGTRAGQQPVLDRLADSGLVLTHPAAAGRLYTLNRKHVLCESVLSAYQARSRLLRMFHEELDKMMPHPRHALIYGSFARGQASSSSDIDLLLIVDEGLDTRSEEWTDQIAALADEVLLWTGNPLQTLSYSTAALSRLIRSGEPIVDHWRTDGIRILGDHPEDLFATESR